MSFAVHRQAQSDPLLRKLNGIADLSAEERQAILNLPMNTRVFEADTDIFRDGERPSECCLVIDGFVGRYKILPDGKRQILGFYIPGDMPDLQSLHLGVMDSSVGTLVRSRVALISHQNLRDLLRRYPNLGEALWRTTLIDAAIFREWMIGMGRRTAFQRIAHLLCELRVRMGAAGLGGEDGYDLPATQNELADALGLSTVHVNRVLQSLRGEGLIVLRGGSLSIPDWDALKAAAEFDPAYLHLKR